MRRACGIGGALRCGTLWRLEGGTKKMDSVRQGPEKAYCPG